MKITGKIIQEGHAVDTVTVSIDDDSLTFREQLEAGLINVCRELKLTVPVWMKKNTSQLAAIAKVTFDRDQFVDEKQLRFDKVEISVDR